jgi:hypothetical protein
VKEIAVDGCTFKYFITVTPPSYSVNDPSDGKITTLHSGKVKADGKGVHKNGAGFSATLSAPPTGIGGVVAPPAFPITGSFNSTARKVKADGQLVLLKGDKTAVMTANFTDTNSQTGITVPITVTVIAEIDDPGQTKAVAN